MGSRAGLSDRQRPDSAAPQFLHSRAAPPSPAHHRPTALRPRLAGTCTITFANAMLWYKLDNNLISNNIRKLITRTAIELSPRTLNLKFAPHAPRVSRRNEMRRASKQSPEASTWKTQLPSQQQLGRSNLTRPRPPRLRNPLTKTRGRYYQQSCPAH